MRQIPAVDPKNPSGSWVALLGPSEFAVQHFDPKRNLVMGIDGKLPDAGNHILLVFDNLSEAEDYSVKKVEASPALGCVIYDHRGRLVKQVINEHAPESRPRAPGTREILLGALFLIGGGLLVYADVRVRLTLIIGVLIGARFIFAGIVNLVRGIRGVAAKRRARKQDRERSRITAGPRR